MGKVKAGEGTVAAKKEVKKPPIDECLNLYDLEEVAQKTMKATSWGYYSTGDKVDLSPHDCVASSYTCKRAIALITLFACLPG